MKIVALNGLLGYGYTEEALELAFSEKVDFLGVDAGSTDPGPYYLGSGKSFTDRGAVKRDLSLALPKALEQKAPFIIGTAGGAGSEADAGVAAGGLNDGGTGGKQTPRLGIVEHKKRHAILGTACGIKGFQLAQQGGVGAESGVQASGMQHGSVADEGFDTGIDHKNAS